MKTIFASTWNALIDRLRREQVIGCTVTQYGSWKHPWYVTPAWNKEREEWACEINPGFVNGLDPEVRLQASEAPEETLGRLGATQEARVDAWLTEAPQIPLRQWRAIGDEGLPDTGERMPPFFQALTEGESEKKRRLLRACEIVLRHDRIAAGTSWNLGSGSSGSFAQFSVSYGRRPGARERAYLRTTSRYDPPTPPDPLDLLLGKVVDEGIDSLHLSTVYLLSPEGASPESPPDASWTPFVRHRVFWNLIYAVRFDPPVGRTDDITLYTGLGGGIADGMINQMLAQNNDASAAAMQFLSNRSIEGRFWTI